jgi:hypothetical protein
LVTLPKAHQLKPLLKSQLKLSPPQRGASKKKTLKRGLKRGLKLLKHRQQSPQQQTPPKQTLKRRASRSRER